MKLKSDYITLNQSSRLYNVEVPIIGLTGGIATGKSTVSNFLKEKGLALICADHLVKEVYKQEQTIKYISKEYPSAIKDNEINFKVLRELFFSDKEIQKNIENFIYQKLPQEFLKQVKAFNNHDFIIYDVPLLFEKELHHKVDTSIVVYASQELQVKRLISRDHITEELALEIISKQIPIDQKKRMSDFVIDNCGGLEDTLSSTKEVFSKLVTTHLSW